MGLSECRLRDLCRCELLCCLQQRHHTHQHNLIVIDSFLRLEAVISGPAGLFSVAAGSGAVASW